VLSPVVPLGIVVACAFYLYKHSGESLFHSSPVIFMMMFGFSTAKITCNLVVSSFALLVSDFCGNSSGVFLIQSIQSMFMCILKISIIIFF